jgi:peptidoglycan/LPS O-acetylase OafA/YrhL
LGIIHYSLPGVFTTNPLPNVVNEQLWTVQFELQCYVILSLLAFLGVFRRRYTMFFFSIVLQIALLAQAIILAHGHFRLHMGPANGSSLVMVFLSGVTLYALRERIILNVWLFLTTLAVTLIGLCVPFGEYFISYPVAYLTIYIGFLNPKANFLHKLGDLSYGIYLYGFPLQQLTACLTWARHWYISFPISLALSILIAAISWNFVEKPALALKRYLPLLKSADDVLNLIKVYVRSGISPMSKLITGRSAPLIRSRPVPADPIGRRSTVLGGLGGVIRVRRRVPGLG